MTIDSKKILNYLERFERGGYEMTIREFAILLKDSINYGHFAPEGEEAGE